MAKGTAAVNSSFCFISQSLSVVFSDHSSHRRNRVASFVTGTVRGPAPPGLASSSQQLPLGQDPASASVSTRAQQISLSAGPHQANSCHEYCCV